MVVRPIEYICDICKIPYQHWLVSDRLWATLPVQMQNLVICQSCFACGRFLNKGMSKCH